MDRTAPPVSRWITRMPRRTGIALLSVLVVLIAARIAAPFVIEEVLNRRLANLPDYRGSIDDVDLAVLDSEFAVDGLRLDKRKGNPKLPFMRIERMEVDYHWDALFDGEIVADVDIIEPVINVMPAATQNKDVKDQIKKDEEGQAVTETFRTLLPTKIHHLHVRDGAVRFKDSEAKPPVDLELTRLNAYISNLSNRPAPASQLPTRGRISARMQNSGRLRANLGINIFTRHPTFDLDLAYCLGFAPQPRLEPRVAVAVHHLDRDRAIELGIASGSRAASLRAGDRPRAIARPRSPPRRSVRVMLGSL